MQIHYYALHPLDFQFELLSSMPRSSEVLEDHLGSGTSHSSRLKHYAVHFVPRRDAPSVHWDLGHPESCRQGRGYLLRSRCCPWQLPLRRQGPHRPGSVSKTAAEAKGTDVVAPLESAAAAAG